MKVAIVGSREYPSLNEVRLLVAQLPEGSTVVTGGAKGVDREAQYAANDRGLACIVICADWDTYGRQAGALRNVRIVAACDRLVAFWDGRSRGTQDVMRKAMAAGKPIDVHMPSAALPR